MLGFVLNKAKLYDEGIHLAGKEAATKAVMVLAKYSEAVEKFMYEIRESLQQAGFFPGPEEKGTPTKPTGSGMTPPTHVKSKEQLSEERTPSKGSPAIKKEESTGGSGSKERT